MFYVGDRHSLKVAAVGLDDELPVVIEVNRVSFEGRSFFRIIKVNAYAASQGAGAVPDFSE